MFQHCPFSVFQSCVHPQHLIERHKRLLEERRPISDVFTNICETGTVFARVTTRAKLEAKRQLGGLNLMLRDIDYLPEMQWGLTATRQTAFVMLNTPLPENLTKLGEGVRSCYGVVNSVFLQQFLLSCFFCCSSMTHSFHAI